MTNLILCPLKKELQALMPALSLKTELKTLKSGHQYHVEKDSAFTLCGIGKAEAGVRAAFWIEKLEPKNVILCGTAGRLNPELELYQTVIAKETIEHDFKNRFTPSSLPRFPGCSVLLEKLSGPFLSVASGDEDVVTVERGKEIRELTGAACVAWEGAGVARACKLYSKNFLEIRAISDFADQSAATDFNNHLRQTMTSIATELRKLL